MAEFGEKYGYHDMYSGDFYEYETKEEYWAFEAKTIFVQIVILQKISLGKIRVLDRKHLFPIKTTMVATGHAGNSSFVNIIRTP